MALQNSEINFYLGSKSPRRKELLSNILPDFNLIDIDVEEIFDESIPATKVATYLSNLKARAAIDKLGTSDVLITADTVIILESTILGKPENRQEAFEMLTSLSNKSHQVMTGVTVVYQNQLIDFAETTVVTFKELTTEEMDYYIDEFKPYDKAGSYGIQEWIGKIGVTNINGCYYNVMGLPVSKLNSRLHEMKLL